MENVKISDVLGTKKVEIPETGIVVTVRDLSWPDFMTSMDIADQIERGIYRLGKVIVDWNITDDDGAVLPVTDENIKKLPAKVVLPLVESVQELFEGKKKATT